MTKEVVDTEVGTPNWGPIGYITYKRTYARPLKNGGTEEWNETIDRILDACDKQLKMSLTSSERQDIAEFMTSMKGMVAGRFLWQLGTPTVKKLGLASLQNCAAVAVNHPIEPFTWAMDMLMLGCGVGYNIQKEYVYELPKVRRAKITRQDTNDADYIVPDSREGWVKLLGRLLKSHFYSGQGFSYSTVLIRGKGAPIKGFGGTASGPEELCWGIGEINAVLNRRAGKKLRPIDALDIMNIIGYVVVAGNVRRSAQIAIGDADDIEFLRAKRWDLGSIPKWRAMSNNSIVWDGTSELPSDFWQGYSGNGEPYGLINLDLSRRIGRLGETEYPDADVIGFNPCAEQPLANYETCCLAEIFLPNITSPEELEKVAIYLYRICKHSLNLGCHHEATGDVVARNQRMGIGITGYLQASEEQKGWLDGCYKKLRAYDKDYSSKQGWPESIKLTTVKPSGTLSLLAGVTPGVHPGYSQYFIRRIRIANDSPLVQKCRSHGYPVEAEQNIDGSSNNNTMVVTFPCSYPAGTTLAADVSAIQQLEFVKRLQTEWSDNAVSCTIYYKPEELDGIQRWLRDNFCTSCKSLSFLLHSAHGFHQAPYEEISKDEYDKLMAQVTPINNVSFQEDDVELGEECSGGQCPIK